MLGLAEIMMGNLGMGLARSEVVKVYNTYALELGKNRFLRSLRMSCTLR